MAKLSIRISALLFVVLLSGCVERRMTIITDPPGARVILNGHEIGNSPVDVPTDQFIYYGHYDIMLVKEGMESILVRQEVWPPWYEYTGIDFISENLVPWHLKDKRVYEYKMQPAKVVPRDELLREAVNLRSRGQLVGPPVEVAPPPTVPSTPPIQINPPPSQP